MPRRKKFNDDSLDVLSLLTPARRQAILDEALGAKVKTIFQRHQNTTLGKLVDALQGDAHWQILQAVRVEHVISERAAEVRNGNGVERHRGRRGRLDPSMLDEIVQVIERAPGLRSEQIQQELQMPAPLVKAGLAKLREAKRVKTAGQRRATTYTTA